MSEQGDTSNGLNIDFEKKNIISRWKRLSDQKENIASVLWKIYDGSQADISV